MGLLARRMKVSHKRSLGEQTRILRHHAHATNWGGYNDGSYRLAFGYNNLTQPHNHYTCLQCREASGIILEAFGIAPVDALAEQTYLREQYLAIVAHYKGDYEEVWTTLAAWMVASLTDATVGVVDGFRLAETMVDQLSRLMAGALANRAIRNARETARPPAMTPDTLADKERAARLMARGNAPKLEIERIQL